MTVNKIFYRRRYVSVNEIYERLPHDRESKCNVYRKNLRSFKRRYKKKLLMEKGKGRKKEEDFKDNPITY